jgi:hypothetical protein
MSFINCKISQLMVSLSYSIGMLPSYCAGIWLECCWMWWDSPWPVPISMHQKKVQLIMVVVAGIKSFLHLGCPSLMNNDEVFI